MSDLNPYQAYTDDSILNSNPLGLVVALYEGAIKASETARKCLANRDIPSRTVAINRIVNILAELMSTLDDEKGGDFSKNLRQLYAYINGRVLDAHLKQRAEPLEEAERLLKTLLEGWKEATVRFNPEAMINALPQSSSTRSIPVAEEYSYSGAGDPYGSYLPDHADYSASAAYAF